MSLFFIIGEWYVAYNITGCTDNLKLFVFCRRNSL